MIINKLWMCTRLPVWSPKYSAVKEYGEPVALLHKNKVDFGSPVIIVDFSAKHLQGQRFAIRKEDAQRHDVGTNGKAPMYLIPMSHFESWESAQEVRDIAEAIFS